MDHSAYSSFSGLRLARLLSEVASFDPNAAKHQFSENFGQLIGLSGSLNLSDVHGELAEMDAKFPETKTPISREVIQKEFMESRKKILQLVSASFIPGSKFIRDRLPEAEALHSHFELSGIYLKTKNKKRINYTGAYEPYRKFYKTRQRDLEIKTQQLRTHISKKIAGISPDLARISLLDTAFYNILSSKVRDILGKIPILLEKRFGSLLDDHLPTLSEKDPLPELKNWIAPSGWISIFCGEMREFLLAELEFRLQPVLGMIESVPETFSSN